MTNLKDQVADSLEIPWQDYEKVTQQEIFKVNSALSKKDFSGYFFKDNKTKALYMMNKYKSKPFSITSVDVIPEYWLYKFRRD